MWQHIKIPLKTPDDNLYEVVADQEITRTASISVDSLHPKLVKQIKILKKRMELVAHAYKNAEKEKKSLVMNLNSSEKMKEELSQEKEQLMSKIKTLDGEINTLKEKIVEITKQMAKLSNEGGQTRAEDGHDRSGEEATGTSISYEPKIYIDVEEKVINEEGLSGDDYQ